jgi:hypothetical protein
MIFGVSVSLVFTPSLSVAATTNIFLSYLTQHQSNRKKTVNRLHVFLLSFSLIFHNTLSGNRVHNFHFMHPVVLQYNLFIIPVTTQQTTKLYHLQSRYMFRLYSHHQANTMITHIYTLQNCCTDKTGYNIIKIFKNTWRKNTIKLYKKDVWYKMNKIL